MILPYNATTTASSATYSALVSEYGSISEVSPGTCSIVFFTNDQSVYGNVELFLVPYSLASDLGAPGRVQTNYTGWPPDYVFLLLANVSPAGNFILRDVGNIYSFHNNEYTNIVNINGSHYYGLYHYLSDTSKRTIYSYTKTGIFDLPIISSVSSLYSSITIAPIRSEYPIVYRNTNCISSGPAEASVGDAVQVEYTFPEGYGIVNPSTDIYVTNNGVVVQSSYSNGILTFTMPDPS